MDAEPAAIVSTAATAGDASLAEAGPAAAHASLEAAPAKPEAVVEMAPPLAAAPVLAEPEQRMASGATAEPPPAPTAPKTPAAGVSALRDLGITLDADPLAGSGLVQIETDPAKVGAFIEDEPEGEKSRPARRHRPVAPVPDEGPLVQVETRRDA
ncbi:MAG: hypothetical protein DI596_12130 [Azospira oryzae]|nr:MAG: hypothetical protein DI596_12130 [Azospira oryzae]PZP77600.1 MAG: hypothetical protein DI593_12130 [Azospira oryzae]